MTIPVKITVFGLLMAVILVNSPLKAADNNKIKQVVVTNTPDVIVANMPDVNVVNSPDVYVANEPDVQVTNPETSPVPVRSVARRIPVLCVTAAFQESGKQDATCVTPYATVTPVPSGFFLAVTDVIATSQRANTASGQAVVRVSSESQNGIEFGAGVPIVLKPGETQSLHYQSPHQVLPGGRTPTASVATNFGDVFPVEVHFTGYLVAEDELGR
jgi:hypothetical protein